MRRPRWVSLGLVGITLLSVGLSVPADASDFAPGDLFVGVGDGAGGGKYRRYSSSGVLLETLDTGYSSSYMTGCALDGVLDLYTTSFQSNRLVKLSHAVPHQVLLNVFTNGTSGPPDLQNESVILDSSTHFFVGHVGGIGASQVHRYDPKGVLVGEYTVAIENQGSDWIDLAADQCTLYYTSEGRTIKRYDICKDAQLPDFAALPSGTAFALRLLPPGDGSGGLVLADASDIKRLDGSGAVIATYDAPGEDYWFAMNLTPDGQSFWSANIQTGNLYRFNLSTGLVELGPIAVAGAPLKVAGLCVAGEPTAATCPWGTPEIVRDLLAVRRTTDVYLQWRIATDTGTDHYDPWKVVNRDKTLIPVANGITALTNPNIVAACPAVPRLAPSCTDAGVVPPPPPLVFYQIRGACTSGVEGTDHPF